MPLRCSIRLASILSVAALSACAGMREFDFITGQCAEDLDRCLAEQCMQLVDSAACQEECRFEARTCERRQGTEGKPRARLGDDQAFLLDLRGHQPHHSSALRLERGGTITRGEGYHVLAPGAFLKLDLTLPPETRQAEVVLTHRPLEGGPCYLTLTAGSGTLLGRYQPPKMSRLRAEVFDFTRYLPKVEKGGPIPITLTIFNNDAAGSTAPYALAEVQIFYRALQAPPEVEP